MIWMTFVQYRGLSGYSDVEEIGCHAEIGGHVTATKGTPFQSATESDEWRQMSISPHESRVLLH